MGSALVDLQLPGQSPEARIQQQLAALQEQLNNLRTQVRLTPPGTGPAGPAGPTGPTGATGATGAAGAAGAAGAPKTIQDEGVSLTQRDKLNFIGQGVVVTDNPTTLATDVTVTATGSGGSGSDAPIVQSFSAASAVNIIGLDGNTDQFYEVTLFVTAQSVSSNIYMQPNGDTTLANYSQWFAYDDSAAGAHATSGGASWPGAIISSTGAAGSHVAKVVIQAAGSTKHMLATGGGASTRTWQDTTLWSSASNLTSLNILPASGTFTGTVILRKIKSPATVLGGPKIVRGMVNSSGTILSGSGFTVVRNSTGRYTVTMTEAFTQLPAITLALQGSTGGGETISLTGATTVTPSSFEVQCNSGASFVDRQWSFECIDTSGASVKYDNNVILSGPKIVRGTVSGAGAIVSGQGFTVAKTGTGTYQINVTQPFAAAPIVTAVGQSWFVYTSASGRTGSVFQINNYNTNTNALVDGAFEFIAVDASSAGVASWSAPTRVTTLPAGQPDGTEVYFQPDPSNQPGVIWNMRYDATAAKWDFIGGSPLYAEVATGENLGSANVYVALTTAGPSLSIPVAGVYDVGIGYSIRSVTTGLQSWMSYDIGGTGAVDADAASTMGSYGDNASRERRKTFTGAVNLVAKYKADTVGNTVTFKERWMRITPVRIG